MDHKLTMVQDAISDAIELARDSRTPERSDSNRAKAIVITELEKVFAYWAVFVMPANEE